MSERRSRFLNLEKPRSEGPAAGTALGTGRFDILEQPGATPPQVVTATSPARFDPARQTDTRGIELQERGAEEQPFLRCAYCEVDNNAQAVTCSNCNRSLETPEQRDFNQRLWARRRIEAQQEAEGLARFREQKERAANELDPRRFGTAAEFASEVDRSTRRRLALEDQAEDWGHGRGDWILRRLIAAIPARVGQVLLLVAVIVGLVLLMIPATRPIAIAGAVVVLLLYLRIAWGHWWW